MQGSRTGSIRAEPIPETGRWLPLTARLLGGLSAPLIWVALGFVAGALFWHFVGFWSFVTAVVFNGPQRAPERLSPASEITTGAIPLTPSARLARLTERSGIAPNCSAHRIDRRDGRAKLVLCSPPDLGLRHVPSHGRTHVLAAQRPASGRPGMPATAGVPPTAPLAWETAGNAP